MHNYADDKTLARFSKLLPLLVKVLEEEADNALFWLDQDETTANPNKFHALSVKKRSDKYFWNKSCLSRKIYPVRRDRNTPRYNTGLQTEL